MEKFLDQEVEKGTRTKKQESFIPQKRETIWKLTFERLVTQPYVLLKMNFCTTSHKETRGEI